MRGIHTIDPETPFLASLARGLIDQLGGELALSLVLLPSRRACLALRDAFLEAAPGDALLLPRMQPVGEVAVDELLLVDQGEALLPPAVHPLRRQLLLARLVKQQRASQGGITDEHAIRLAGELAAFLDEMQTEEVSLERLVGLVPQELASHWQQILGFLQILSAAWPAILAEEGAVDPAERRRLLLDQVAAGWSAAPPAHPIIAAGITGTVPAVARLLACVADLPRGTLVLPGLDRDLDEAQWQAVAGSAAHPQHGMHRLLGQLGVAREHVATWPAPAALPRSTARRRFLGEIMRPASTSDAWCHVAPPGRPALDGLSRVDAPDFHTEAMLLALQLREALEQPGRTAALVTSDRTLARRVAIELGRFAIEVDDTAGTPLDQTPPGSFLLLAARAIVEDLSPVPLLALLKHPLARGGLDEGAFRRHARALDRAVLRGPRSTGGLAGLLRAIDEAAGTHWPAPIPPEELCHWLAAIDAAAAPFARLVTSGEAAFVELLDAHLAFGEWLARDVDGDPCQLWAKEAGDATSRFIADLRLAAADFPPIDTSAYPALLAVLMGSVAVRAAGRRHPRVSILGQLESRLMSADRVLVAGLNEGVWPRPPEPSPWINRAMRQQLGLPPAELQIGIAAHDLVMSACAPEVILSRARKDAGGAPTTASRWLTRLDAVLLASGSPQGIAADSKWLDWARALDEPDGPPVPCPRPNPKPPVACRPSEAWVTELETLIRDPYAFYARKILGLDALDPLDADPGAAERGQIIHKALELFVRDQPGALPDDALSKLLAVGAKLFDEASHHPQVRAIWWPRFLDIAAWFIDQERQRRDRLARIMVERRGKLEIDTASGRFILKARADRVELSTDGHVNLVDYKTGGVPGPGEVQAGVSPQLTLTALIAAGGGFEEAGGVPGELLYWALRGGSAGNASQPAGGTHASVEEMVAAARDGIVRLIDWFRDPDNGYAAVPRPEIAPTYNDYEHLARIDEWRGGTGEAEEEA